MCSECRCSMGYCHFDMTTRRCLATSALLSGPYRIEIDSKCDATFLKVQNHMEWMGRAHVRQANCRVPNNHQNAGLMF